MRRMRQVVLVGGNYVLMAGGGNDNLAGGNGADRLLGQRGKAKGQPQPDSAPLSTD